MKPFALLTIVACFTHCGPAPPPASQVRYLDEPPADFPLVSGVPGPDDIGLFLAGMPVRRGAGLSRLQQTVDYQIHRQEMEAASRLARIRTNLMRSWSNRELASLVGGGTVLYPFGGPDLLYVNAMFPAARNYVLMGLEPVGEVPAVESLPPGEALALLALFRRAVNSELRTGYFITKEMRSDIQGGSLRGVTPILLGTVALIGGRVEAVNGISAGGKPGVGMAFRDPSGARHRAIYVLGDLSNSGFNADYRRWLEGLNGNVVYFKAASYLMHDDGFSQARDVFLNQSRVIVQDDSGIPFNHFGAGWSLRFYGNFERPIDLFAKHRQEDLRHAFATNPSRPLAFGTGYHVNQFAGNLLATKSQTKIIEKLLAAGRDGNALQNPRQIIEKLLAAGRDGG
jgi:hypothetical protein